MQRSEQNTELVNFREKRAESQQVEDKYLDVLEHAKNVAKTNGVMVARLGYREVATHYSCAYKNDGYRVMEEMAERVPGVSYKESRTQCVDDAMGAGGHHIEITFAHPDLAGGDASTRSKRGRKRRTLIIALYSRWFVEPPLGRHHHPRFTPHCR
ncbi:hypothetical protein SAMN05421858_4835 [Haladaptatus litoreus]|uniref:Uncharacterized protein n=1 Tax=Haladaptatus litoreus TaxID=553468 RepID=A0A1N7F9B8_9EURY|nr:hypothetical protein [Haladaptatus litoreus]SIR96852.1 hypothetical protein SAMN05421858_4835 [Haladaptatus litoreus]